VNALSSLFRSRRLWGLAGTALTLGALFLMLKELDVSGVMPDTQRIAQTIIEVWPHMPFFEVQKGPNPNGDGTYTYYTVPTRQFSQEELKQLGVTNVVAQPAKPKN
jgi:hypothetical protein